MIFIRVAYTNFEMFEFYDVIIFYFGQISFFLICLRRNKMDGCFSFCLFNSTENKNEKYDQKKNKL